MRKSPLGLLLIALIVVSLVTATTMHFSGAQSSGTDVSGVIASDTVWTQAGSPYNLTENVFVNSKVTLTIQAGATVNLFGFYIQVSGVLVARGNSNDGISIYRGGIFFVHPSAGWNKRTGSGCIIQDCDFFQSYVNISDCSPKISGSIFRGTFMPSIINVDGGSPIIFNNTFTDNVHTDIALWSMTPCLDCDNAIELGDTNATIVDNTIEKSLTGIQVDQISNTITGTVIIERNYIFNNSLGVGLGAPLTIVFENNTLAQNGGDLAFAGYSSKSILRYNNFYLSNSSFWGSWGSTNDSIALGESLGQSTNVNATYNWWGTTDSQLINQSFYICNSTSTVGSLIPSLTPVGSVNFTPFLTRANTQAMPDLTLTTNYNSFNSNPEFLALLILTLFILVITSALLIARRKRGKAKIETQLH